MFRRVIESTLLAKESLKDGFNRKLRMERRLLGPFRTDDYYEDVERLNNLPHLFDTE